MKLLLFCSRSKTKHVGDLLDMLGAHHHSAAVAASSNNASNGAAAKAAASNVPFLPGLMQNKQSEVLQKLSAVSAGSEQLPDDSFFETLMKVTFCSEPPSSISQTKEL